MPTYIEQTDDYWVLKDDEGCGTALVLRTLWTNRLMRLVTKYGVNIIRLNEHAGWQGFDLSFLADIPGIDGVDVLSEKVTDVSPLFQLTGLKTLSLFCKAKVGGDFTKLTDLRQIGLGWRSVFRSVFGHGTLQSVNIIGYPERDLSSWMANPHLERLRLQSRELEALRGLECFPNIRHLHLYRCPKLKSFGGIEVATSIQELRISHCAGVRDWSPIEHLRQLRILEIEDCRNIQSVIPFGKCRELERLQIAGNTTILDRDLSCLAGLPKLRDVLLARRKQYSHVPSK
jgi:Leucine-rich repeat (LRR) protein